LRARKRQALQVDVNVLAPVADDRGASGSSEEEEERERDGRARVECTT